jgi:S1-C subfamily serine protease
VALFLAAGFYTFKSRASQTPTQGTTATVQQDRAEMNARATDPTPEARPAPTGAAGSAAKAGATPQTFNHPARAASVAAAMPTAPASSAKNVDRSATIPDSPTAKAPVASAATQQPARLSSGEISAKFSRAVVVLENYNDRGQKVSQGSGFIYAPEGKVLTNYHVIRGATRMIARLRDGSTAEVEYVAAYDFSRDVAALAIDGSELPCVRLGDSSSVKTGDHVTVLGAPLGLDNTLSDGIISAIREGGSLRAFQTTAPISHGSSGGPLFDDYGNVIGIAVATLEGGENLNFAVSIDSAKPILARNESITFDRLLSATAIHQSLFSSSVSLPPQQASVDVVVPQQGGRLVGKFTIAGGLGNDLGVRLVGENGAVVWNGGVLTNYAVLDIPLRGGRYKLVLDNKLGPLWMSNKTISGAVELMYYR